MQCSFTAPQGDRGFDGLAGLPGEKGHRVSHSVEGLHVYMIVVMWATAIYLDVCRCRVSLDPLDLLVLLERMERG